MKSTYRALAGLIALGVLVQAASIAYGAFSLTHALDNGKTLGKNTSVGDAGFGVHAVNGQMIIPLLAIALFVVSFRAPVRDAVRMAGGVLGAVVVQVALGFASHALPVLGWLHGIVALGIFAMAGNAARVASTTQPSAAESAP